MSAVHGLIRLALKNGHFVLVVAMPGVCVVKDFFQENISLDTAMSQVTSYAMSDMFYLPPGTIPPMVMPFDPTAMTPLCLLSVSSATHNEKELYDIAYF